MNTNIRNEVKGAIELVAGKPVIQLQYIAQWQGRQCCDVNKQVRRSPLSEEFKAQHAAPSTYLAGSGRKVSTYLVTLEGILAMGLINQRGENGVELIDALVELMTTANHQDKAAARINELQSLVSDMEIDAVDQANQIHTLRLAVRSGKVHPNKHEKQLEHFASQAAIIYHDLENEKNRSSKLQGELVLVTAELDKTKETLRSVRADLRDANEKGAEKISELNAQLKKKAKKQVRRQQKVRLIELNKKGKAKFERASEKLVKRLEELAVESQNPIRELMNNGKSLKNAMRATGFELLTK
ncbi:hypothetical protein GR7B_00057 [Vibrio phage vB_VcorM_GR7B]|nr:hypothetical protein GR7B_00057 [Vibrio phage vB_VcorM_GR7B]